MENRELNKLEKQLSKIMFEEDPLKNLINHIDEIYILLDENMRIDIYNDQLSTVKKTLAKSIDKKDDTTSRQTVFENSKNELLLLMNEISTHI